LAVQGFFGHLPVIAVLLLVAVQSCFGAGGGPAARTFVPRLLPPGQLAAGLALNRIAFQGPCWWGPRWAGWFWAGWASAAVISSTRSRS